jgi:hypothetical protein
VLKQIFAYLNATAKHKLTFDAHRLLSPLAGYVNANRHLTKGQHAVLGYAFTINSSAVLWSLKHQELVTLSTMEAKYIAQTHAAKEALWFLMLCAEVLGALPTLLTLYVDNQGAIALACNN